MATERVDTRSRILSSVLFAVFVASFLSVPFVPSLYARRQVPAGQLGYQDTPMQPNGKWHIHDGTRPQPPIVTPAGPVTTPPPSDAIVLMGSGAHVSQWQMTEGGGPATWTMADGVLPTGKGMIRTKRDDFTDFQ